MLALILLKFDTKKTEGCLLSFLSSDFSSLDGAKSDEIHLRCLCEQSLTLGMDWFIALTSNS